MLYIIYSRKDCRLIYDTSTLTKNLNSVTTYPQWYHSREVETEKERHFFENTNSLQ